MRTSAMRNRPRDPHTRSTCAVIAGCLATVALFVVPAFPQTTPLSGSAVQQLIEAALYQYFDAESSFTIATAGATLRGSHLMIEDLLIEGKPAIIRGMRGELLAHFTRLGVEIPAPDQVKIATVGHATIVATSTARDVQDGLAALSTTVLSPTVQLEAGQFEIAAKIKRGDRLYPAVARGNLVIDNGRRLRVVLRHAEVSGGDVPRGLVENELAKINPVVDLTRWPLSLRIDRIAVHNGRVEVLMTSAPSK